MLAVLFTLPMQKTSASGGIAARFAVPDAFTFLVVAGTLVAIARGRGGDWGSLRVPRQFYVGLVLFLTMALASFFVTETASRSLVETIAYSVNIALLACIVFHVRTRPALYRCLRAWEAGVILVVAGGLIGVVMLFLGNVDSLLTNGPKVTSTFKKSGQLSLYLTASLPLLWFQWAFRSHTTRVRLRRMLLIALALICLFATGSRTGFLLGVGLVGVLFGGRVAGSFLRSRPALKLSGLGLAALAAGPLLVILFHTLPFSFQRAFSIAQGVSSLEVLSPTRHYQLQGFEVAAVRYPFTGVGVGDFFSRNTALAPGAWSPHEIHNTYLGVWAETGIIGVVALFVFLLATVQAGWQVVANARDRELQGLAVALLISWLVLIAYGVSAFELRTRHLWVVFAFLLVTWNVMWRERCGLVRSDPAGTPPTTHSS
jgi:O-antigen ligase